MALWTRAPKSAPTQAGTQAPAQAGQSGSVADWLAGRTDPATIAELLRQVIDPEVGVNIVDLGLVYSIRVSDGTAVIQMSLTTPGCPLSAYMEDNIHRVLWGAPGISSVDLRIIWEPAWTTEMMSVRAKQELGWPV